MEPKRTGNVLLGWEESSERKEVISARKRDGAAEKITKGIQDQVRH